MSVQCLVGSVEGDMQISGVATALCLTSYNDKLPVGCAARYSVLQTYFGTC